MVWGVDLFLVLGTFSGRSYNARFRVFIPRIYFSLYDERTRVSNYPYLFVMFFVVIVLFPRIHWISASARPVAVNLDSQLL